MLTVLGILGLVWTVPAGAQTTVKIFDKTYNVVKERRDQEFKKQGGGSGKVVLVPRDIGSQLANLDFAQGADPSQDRLFVGCNIVADGTEAHQFYQLRGTDANGVFSKDVATLTEYFGGAVSMERGGRPTGFMWLNDENTGVGTDRNIAISTFWNDDYYRLYDFDKMTGVAGDNSDGLNSDAVYSINLTDTDLNSPGTGFTCYAKMPQNDGHTAVVFANGGESVAVGVWDTKMSSMFPVVTNITEVTASATVQMPAGYRPTSAFHQAGNEYWILVQDVEAGPGLGGAAGTSSRIYRANLTFPADLSKATPGSIKAELLGFQELHGTPLHGVDAATGEGIVYGMAKGREVAPGLNRLYFGDSEGNIFVATPVP
jgi:hypothetical protein